MVVGSSIPGALPQADILPGRWPFPLAEQRRIVAKVEQLMALVDALEIQLATARATAANLLSALVAELTSTSANGASPSQPGATPQGKARMDRAVGALGYCVCRNPGALPQAGINRAFGPEPPSSCHNH